MTLNIGTWNSDGRIGTSEGAAALVAWVQRDNLDAAALPQACSGNVFTSHFEELRRQLGELGYLFTLAPYGDTDNRPDGMHNLGLVVRRDRLDGDVEHLRLGKDEHERRQGIGRVALHCVLNDQLMHNGAVQNVKVDFFGMHFDDRLDETRLGQEDTLLMGMDRSKRTIIAGDPNAMHTTDIRAAGFRLAGQLLGWIVPAAPGVPAPARFSPSWFIWVPHRIASLAQRLRDMALSGVLQVFEDNGFRDADPRHSATSYFDPFRIVRAQLEYVLVNNGLKATVKDGQRRLLGGRHRTMVAAVEAVPFQWPDKSA